MKSARGFALGILLVAAATCFVALGWVGNALIQSQPDEQQPRAANASAAIDQLVVTAGYSDFAEYQFSFSGKASGVDEIYIILVDSKYDDGTTDYNSLNRTFCGAGPEYVSEKVGLWCQKVTVQSGHWRATFGAFADETDLTAHVFTASGTPLTTGKLKVTYPPPR